MSSADDEGGESKSAPMEGAGVAELEKLTALARELQGSPGLMEVMQKVSSLASDLLQTPRVSIRLFSLKQDELIAVCRVGEALHFDAARPYRRGEGLIGWVAGKGSPIRTGTAEQDPRYFKRLDMKEPMVSFLGVPLMAGRTAMGVLSAVNSQPDYFTPHHEALMMLLAAICAPRIEVARLSHLSRLDPLTGALNRRALEEQFPTDLSQCRGLVDPYSLAMLEIDHFRVINDTYGHAVGDGVLQHVVRTLSGLLQERYGVVRYGGDDFLILLPGVGLEAAARIAERMRAAVERSALAMGGISVSVTITLGVAQREPSESRTDLSRRAEASLNNAREEGRNRVSVSR
ncbi:MAG: sensor domain-containing diguanylate cyclase [Bradymonadales bacterium]|nr:sensor domain-containing diguanylate cyclase [Bradymonadales bacterium]